MIQSALLLVDSMRSLIRQPLIIILAAGISLPAATAFAQTQTETKSTQVKGAEAQAAEVQPAAPVMEANATASPLAEQTLGAWPYRPWENMKGGARHLFDSQNRWSLGIGALALLGSRGLDEEGSDYMLAKRRIGDLDDLGNHVLGTGVPGVLIAAGFWLYGDLTDSHYETHAGQAHVESIFVTSLITSVLKGSVGRERPDESDRYSFPSGHTSTVFASAMALHEFYGWKVGAPAFLLGALTGAARMSDGRHWFSDTIGGALVGIVVGHAYSRHHLDTYNGFKAKSEGPNVSWFPIFEENGGRLMLLTEF